MYKVVIIDDEPIIVTGLKKLVPWASYGCEVAGTAFDGMEGLELIRRIRPDIVFCDIYMPKMDGLMMTAALKSEFENMELAILTGYRDFELLQQALHLGVARFILKPSNMEELEEAVETMTARLRKKGILPECEDRSADGQDGSPGNMSGEAPGQDPEAVSQAGSFIVKNALAYMKENYRHKMSLKDVADNTYVSQWHLSRLLNSHTGQSFSELLNTIRIDAAKELLKNPALRIGDVADEVGFLDIAHFSRVFRKITGVSANEYRNRLK